MMREWLGGFAYVSVRGTRSTNSAVTTRRPTGQGTSLFCLRQTLRECFEIGTRASVSILSKSSWRGTRLLSGERNCPSATECLSEPGDHHEVSVNPNPFDAACPQRREAVLILEPAKLALDRGATPVEVASYPAAC
jgi:hypothetical protein